MEKSIFCKLDWFSAIIPDVSISEICKWLTIDDKIFVQENTAQQFAVVQGIYQKWRITSNGISFDLNLDDKIEGPEVLNHIFRHPIRLEISGSGLEYIRQKLNIDIDSILQDETGFHKMSINAGVTRCDFAFDFINFKTDITGILVDFIQTNVGRSDLGTFNHAVILNNTCSIRTDLRLDNQRTCYFGSNQSDKMLRVYDKRLQYIDHNTGIYVKENPYEDPQSWHRIEWQLRSRYAESILFSEKPSGLFSILKNIVNYYRFADMQTPAWRRLAYDPWLDFTSQIDDGSLIDCVKYSISRNYVYISPAQKKDLYLEEMCATNILRYLILHGSEQLYSVLMKRLVHFENPSGTDNPDFYTRGYLKLLTDLNASDIDWKSKIPEDSPFYLDDNNHWQRNEVLSFDVPLMSLYTILPCKLSEHVIIQNDDCKQLFTGNLRDYDMQSDQFIRQIQFLKDQLLIITNK